MSQKNDLFNDLTRLAALLVQLPAAWHRSAAEIITVYRCGGKCWFCGINGTKNAK